MNAFAWDPTLETGHPVIDAQHLELFNALEDIHVDITRGDNVKGVEDALLRLSDYINSHFADEEALMAACAYPGFESQRRMHREFTEKTNALMQQYLAGELVMPMTVAIHMFDWLEHHVRTADSEMAKFVRDAGC